jgi:peptidoglycan hydrolase-like protein with peptidoglycan-binding domain
MKVPTKQVTTIFLMFSVLFLTATQSVANKEKKRPHQRVPTRTEAKEAERRLSELGYWTGPVDGAIDSITRTALTAFQKWEGREVTGRLSLNELEAIRDASAPRARDTGYGHVEVDIDRQVLLLIDEEGATQRILPVSTGSGKQYREKGGRGLAYTPKGRFRIYGKASGWKRSPLGLLYYPNYFSDGVAIHGNPSVPSRPESHGCVRIPMFASQTMSKLLPVGTIVLVYDKNSFVSAKAWGEADKQSRSAGIP